MIILMTAFKTVLPNRFRFVEAHFSRMQTLFILDPLFLQTFIYLTPQKDLPVLFKRIPPYLSATWLSQKANKIHSLNKDEVCYVICRVTTLNMISMWFREFKNS